MMGRQTGDQSQLFYLFNLEGRIPARHLLRRINPIVTRILLDLRGKLERFYSELGRPSIDPELMIRMLIVSYCYGIRSERKLCEEVELHLAYRWFCRLGLEDKVLFAHSWLPARTMMPLPLPLRFWPELFPAAVATRPDSGTHQLLQRFPQPPFSCAPLYLELAMLSAARECRLSASINKPKDNIVSRYSCRRVAGVPASI